MATTVESLRKTIGKKKQTQAFAWLADLMRASGDLDGALQCVQAGLEAFPENIEGQLVLSKILVEKQDWDGVIQACEFVLLRNPYCLSALRRLGDAYAQKHDEGNRNYYYQLLHDLDPLDPFWREEYAPQIDIASAEDSVAPAVAMTAAAEPSLEDLLKEAPPLDLDGSSVFEKAPEKFVPAQEETLPAEEKTDLPSQEASTDEDPFSNLSSLVSSEEEKDNEVSFDDLEHSLDDAIAGFAPTDTSKDEFPTDEIEGSDISSALSGIFGSAETEEPEAPVGQNAPAEASPFADIPVEETPVQEEKAQSLSDAFDDIFGEDELPEEFVLSKPAAPAAETAPSAPETFSADALDEKTNEESPLAEELPSLEEGGLFEKSSSADLELPKTEEKQEEPSEAKAEESLETSVENSLGSLFGDDDDLPVENLNVQPKTEEKQEEPSKAKAEESLETSVENSLDSLFGEDDDLPVENLNVQPKTEEKQEEPSKAKAEESLETSVENSLDSLFGEDDDLPVENLNVQPKTKESGLFEKSSSADVELAKTEEKAGDSLENSVESSFDNLFGKNSDDELSLDDLKLEEAPAPENTPAEVKKETTLDNSVDSSFDHIFGKDSDDALLEDPTTSTRTLAEIYFGQGVYDEAIKIYKDLLRKNPEDAALKDRLAEIEKIRNDKTLN